LPEDETNVIIQNKKGLKLNTTSKYAKGKDGKEDPEKAKKNKERQDDNAGAAIFEYSDKETGLSQRFAFNLRYYIGADWRDTGEPQYAWIR